MEKAKGERIVLRTADLEVTFKGAEAWPFSERFAGAGVVEQVVLHKKHRFCQPEQKLPGRVTCHGQGLCSEFVWDQLAGEAAEGQFFPKIGVGLLRQRPEGGAYDMWKHYETEAFPTEVYVSGNRVIYRQKPRSCLDIAVELTRTAEVYRNIITIVTKLKNVGKRTVTPEEYHHNFVAIDDYPVGPGYQLEIPFDGTLAELEESTVRIGDYRTPVKEVIKTSGQTVFWKKQMTGTACHKVTEENRILDCPQYWWRLSHQDSPAAVEEHVNFVPSGLVVWGIEHCIWPEVYGRWHVEPGKEKVMVRTWRFEDDKTAK